MTPAVTMATLGQLPSGPSPGAAQPAALSHSGPVSSLAPCPPGPPSVGPREEGCYWEPFSPSSSITRVQGQSWG